MTWKRFVSILALLALVCMGGVAMAAETHTRFVTGVPVWEPKDNSVFLIANTLDFADLRTTAPTGTDPLAGVSRQDTVQLLKIPAGTIVKSVGVRIYSPWSTAGLTAYGVTIGDGDDTDGWIQSVDFGPTASGVSLSGVSGWSDSALAATWSPAQSAYGAVGKYYSAADTIDALFPAFPHTTTYSRCTDFVLQVWAECVYPRTQKAYRRK